MAATDQTYRNQYYLDVVFGVTCVLMLVGTVWMFAQDYFREFKQVQREFRNVEESVAQRTLVSLAPTRYQMQEIEEAQADVAERREALAQVKAELAGPYNELLAKKLQAEERQRFIKADLDSIVSFYNIAIDKRNAEDPDSSAWKAHHAAVESYQRQIDDLKQRLNQAAAEVAEIYAEIDKKLLPQTKAQDALSQSEARLKELTADFDRIHKLAADKKWGFGDSFRSWPVIDAFASPLRIQQYTLEQLPINYSFKYVTRYDRCTTCHLGIDRDNYTAENLRELAIDFSPAVKAWLAHPSTYVKVNADGEPDANGSLPKLPDVIANKMADQIMVDLANQVRNARYILMERQKLSSELASVHPDQVGLRPVDLTAAQIKQFSVHPRLDLFVGVDSPHRAEKFGCTICHSGQGSATDFFNASHSPNTSPQLEHWAKVHGWQSNHYWDYQMLPHRFTESSCIKCHHQVTDLVRQGSQIEAPKVYQGYQLVKEMGCFGCHEISGIKAGKWIGPDLRLEPDPPVNSLPPTERAKVLADTANPPGTMRKVGPNLRRLAEKTNEDWVRQWLMAPRDFRPTTKMPHFYGLSNNTPDVLPPDQKNFPTVEIHAVTHLLFEHSRNYLRAVDERHQDPEAMRERDQQRYEALTSRAPHTLNEDERRELLAVRQRIERRKARPSLASLALPPEPADAKAREQQLRNGRLLFSERGCLACHSHEATSKPGNGLPPLPSSNDFGPDLSRIADKLGVQPGDTQSARRWLVQWVMDPAMHHPRSVMPVTHLTLEQANDIAAWLLSNKTNWKGPAVPEPALADLKKLARLHLEKAVPLKRELDEMLPEQEDKQAVLKGFSKERLAEFKADADEQELSEPLTPDKLKMYIGRKAISYLGCYGCHYIPGYREAKPIGTPLNDWGVKRADRIAFEDGAAFVAKNFHIVPERDDPHDPAKAAPGWQVIEEDGKVRLPYEQFFFDALEHHQREGFLHQKLLDPRSYDYSRIRAWDERLRMPQFRFSRQEPPAAATPQELAAFARAEAEAREAVMTFILGLVADEGIPKTYYPSPAPDRAAEIKGRQVLEKFNCQGCHLVRPAVYDLKIDPRITWLSEPQLQANPAALQVQRLSLSAGNALRASASDHPFLGHIAWQGPAARQNRLTVYGTNPTKLAGEEGESLLVNLTHGLKFPVSVWKDGRDRLVDRDVPASFSIQVLPAALIPQPGGGPYAPAYGGTFADMLVPFLQKLNPTQFPGDATGEATARSVGPPSLLYEGEKTQPEWLFRFLRDPFQIRPITVLRMPRFSLSEEDAQALVDYFSAVDRTANPGIGLEYPYMPIPEREPGYLTSKNADYIRRLKDTPVGGGTAFEQRVAELRPVWSRLLGDQLADTELRLKQAQRRLEDAKEPADKLAVADLIKALNKEAQDLRNDIDKQDYSRYLKRWQDRDAYLVDAYKLLASDQICLGCHQVGSIPAKQILGPPLQLTNDRLRPDWLERWLANPQRFMYYRTPMPQNFPADSAQYLPLFVGVAPARIAAAEKKLAPLEGPYKQARTAYEAKDLALFDARKAFQDDPGNPEVRAGLAKAEKDFAAARDAFDQARKEYEPVAEEVTELKRAFARNQITAVRDALINFHKTTDIPENRGGPVPPLK